MAHRVLEEIDMGGGEILPYSGQTLRAQVRAAAGHWHRDDGPALGVPRLSPQELGEGEDPQERAVAPLLAVFSLRQEPLEDGCG